MTTLTIGLVVAAVYRAVRASTEALDVRPAALWFAVSLGLMLLQGAAATLRRYAEQRLGDVLNLELSSRILDHAATLDLAFFEDPESQDVLVARDQRSRRLVPALLHRRLERGGLGGALPRPGGRADVGGLARGAGAGAGRGAVRRPSLAPGPGALRARARAHAAPTMGDLLPRSRRRAASWCPRRGSSTWRRSSAPASASASAGIHAELSALYARQATGRIVGYAVYLIGLAAAVVWVAARARAGTIDLAGLATFTLAGVRLRTAVSDFAAEIGAAREGSLFLTYLTEFLERRPSIASGRTQPAAIVPAVAPRQSRRPRPARRASSSTVSASPIRAPIVPRLDDLSLSIAPGRWWRWSATTGPARPRSPSCWRGSTSPARGRSASTANRCRPSTSPSWHRRLSLVSESPVVYEASLRENVAFGDWRTLLDDRAEVERIVRESGLDAIAATLKEGIDTELGRGFGAADLSRGQWQRVAIARALAHDPGLLILDEPTANLDAEAEARVYAAVRELARGRTTVLISHRFSTVRLADIIFVLEAGRLVESGSHRELIAANGLYSRLYRLHHPAADAAEPPAARGSGDERRGVMDTSETFIHAGLPRTGTTTLQTHLFARHTQVHYLGVFKGKLARERPPIDRSSRGLTLFRDSQVEALMNELLFDGAANPDSRARGDRLATHLRRVAASAQSMVVGRARHRHRREA